MTAILRKSDANEPFSFVFVDGDSTIVKSENYAQKASVKNGIESVKKNSQEDSRYELKESTNGKFYFNLKASNGQIVATSTMFASEADRATAISTLKAQAPTCEVEDNA